MPDEEVTNEVVSDQPTIEEAVHEVQDRIFGAGGNQN